MVIQDKKCVSVADDSMMTPWYCVLLLAVPATLGQEEARVSCSPEGLVGTSECLARGCLWAPVADPSVPWCHFPPDYGYVVASTTRSPRSTVVALERPGWLRCSSPPHPAQQPDHVRRGLPQAAPHRHRGERLEAAGEPRPDTQDPQVRLEPEGERRFEVPMEIFPPEGGPTST